jgi:hypothetical protein
MCTLNNSSAYLERGYVALRLDMQEKTNSMLDRSRRMTYNLNPRVEQ